HWLPFEITRCANLKKSRISRRALYGNFRSHRPCPFPRLPSITDSSSPKQCSVCRGAFGPRGPIQLWFCLGIATDVLPLLVHPCPKGCVDALPPPAPPSLRAKKGGLGSPPPWAS